MTREPSVPRTAECPAFQPSHHPPPAVSPQACLTESQVLASVGVQVCNSCVMGGDPVCPVGPPSRVALWGVPFLSPLASARSAGWRTCHLRSDLLCGLCVMGCRTDVLAEQIRTRGSE